MKHFSHDLKNPWMAADGVGEGVGGGGNDGGDGDDGANCMGTPFLVLLPLLPQQVHQQLQLPPSVLDSFVWAGPFCCLTCLEILSHTGFLQETWRTSIFLDHCQLLHSVQRRHLSLAKSWGYLDQLVDESCWRVLQRLGA